MTWSKLINLSVPWFVPLWSGDDMVCLSQGRRASIRSNLEHTDVSDTVRDVVHTGKVSATPHETACLRLQGAPLHITCHSYKCPGVKMWLCESNPLASQGYMSTDSVRGTFEREAYAVDGDAAVVPRPLSLRPGIASSRRCHRRGFNEGTTHRGMENSGNQRI